MEYTDEKAEQIIVRYGLSRNTLKVWKYRNAIPDRYFKEGFIKVATMSKEMRQKLSDINEMLETDVFNLSSVCRIADVEYLTFFDAMRGKANITEEDIKKVILEFKKLKAFIMNHVRYNNPQKLRVLADNPELKFYSIHGKDSFGKRMYDKLKKEKIISESDYIKLKENYMKVYIRINLL